MKFSDLSRIVCINLDRREDRWTSFKLDATKAGLPFYDGPDYRNEYNSQLLPECRNGVPRIERLPAIDGNVVTPPKWWPQSKGAWGCYRSHMRLLEDCISQGWDSFLVFEDDATFLPFFQERAASYLAELPDDWGVAYLGGQHLHTQQQSPRPLTENVHRAFNVNRTHAFMVKGKYAPRLYQHLTEWKNWQKHWHIDHALGMLTESGEVPTYCPADWLVGQAAGASDVNVKNKNAPTRFWPSARAASAGHVAHKPFVAIVGLHSSGSSAFAGLCYHLGLHLGTILGGYYGKDPERSCGFEAVQLARICEDAMPFPTLNRRQPSESTQRRLQSWIDNKRKEVRSRGTPAGGKYPHFCILGPELIAACGDKLHVLTIERPLEESIASLVRRTSRDEKVIRDLQTTLWTAAFGDPSAYSSESPLPGGWVSTLPASRVLRTTHHDLLYNTEQVAKRVIDFLKPIGLFPPTASVVSKAVGYVKPEKRNVNLTLSSSPAS